VLVQNYQTTIHYAFFYYLTPHLHTEQCCNNESAG